LRSRTFFSSTSIDAALGHKDDAIGEGRRACKLMPVSRDAFSGPAMITHLAMIYAWTGEKARALEELTKSAQLPAGISYGELKLNPDFDSLRGDPRFDQIAVRSSSVAIFTGRSERPVPRLSKRISRQNLLNRSKKRARCGISQSRSRCDIVPGAHTTSKGPSPLI
jgi:hypothetical protein